MPAANPVEYSAIATEPAPSHPGISLIPTVKGQVARSPLCGTHVLNRFCTSVQEILQFGKEYLLSPDICFWGEENAFVSGE